VPKKKPDGRGRWRRVTIAQWRSVDWTLPNLRIAERLGCSPSLVTIGRRNWGRPFPRRQADVFRAYLAANAKKLHGLPVPEVIRRSGCKLSYNSARTYMRAAGIRTYRFVTDGKRMDWRLPNKALAQVWGHAKEYVARLRWELGAPKARWDSRSKGTAADSAYLRAVAAERQRAEAAAAEVAAVGAKRYGRKRTASRSE
jgi:hypothetical protein